MYQKRNNSTEQRGYITMILVIIIGALTSAIVFTALSDSISSSQAGIALQQTYKARAYANACAEKALYRIHNGDIVAHEDITSSPVSFGSGEQCAYVADISGGSVTIKATGISKVAQVTENVSGTVSSGTVSIISWE